MALHMKKTVASVIVAGGLIALLALSSCAPQQGSSKASSGSDSLPRFTADGQLNDDRCLSCHGGSYEAVAATTADLGDWNPHDPIHGGYNSCGNCHDENMGTENSYCDNCHEFAPGTPTTAMTLK